MKREIAIDVVGLAGLAGIVNGARMVYEPAGWIVAGLALVAWALLKGRE